MPITTYRLQLANSFLDPSWFARHRGGRFTGEVAQDGTLNLDGEHLRFTAGALPSGTSVEIWLNQSGFYVCASSHDLERERHAVEAAEKAQQEERRLQLNLVRDEAIRFNASLKLPAKWTVGIKDVLSGLGASSWGDGRNRATVEHILLLEPLNEGRLKRAAGDFLCSSRPADNGMRYSQIVANERRDGDDKPFVPKVTCKCCLDYSRRWQVEPQAADVGKPAKMRPC